MLKGLKARLILQAAAKLPPSSATETLDRLGQPRAYRGWPYPIRASLARAYLHAKLDLLQQCTRQSENRPRTAEEFHTRLLEGLRSQALSARFLVLCLPVRTLFLYPVIVLCAIASIVIVLNERRNRQVRDALTIGLPEFCDLLHQQQCLHQDQAEFLLVHELLDLASRFGTKVDTRISLRERMSREAVAENGKRLSDIRARVVERRATLLQSFDSRPALRSRIEEAIAALEAGVDAEVGRLKKLDDADARRKHVEHMLLAWRGSDPSGIFKDEVAPDERASDERESAAVTSERIMSLFASVNDQLVHEKLPYYVMPKSVTASGVTFSLDRIQFQENSIQGMSFDDFIIRDEAAKAIGAFRTATMVLPYRVMERRSYVVDGLPCPVFLCQRLDSVPITESAFGLTYRGGHGTQVLVDRVDEFILHSAVPASTPGGSRLMFPYFQQAEFGFEKDVSAAIRKSVESVYGRDAPRIHALARTQAEDLQAIAGNTVRRQLKNNLARLEHSPDHPSDDSPIRSGIDALGTLFDKTKDAPRDSALSPRAAPIGIKPFRQLADRFVMGIATHEAVHRYTAANGVPEMARVPGWYERLKQEHPALAEHARDEMTAYLTGIAYGQGVRHLELTQILTLAMNPLLAGSPEYYATRVVFVSMYLASTGADDDFQSRDELPKMSELSHMYRALMARSDEDLERLSRAAHELVFRRPLYRIEGPGL